MTTDQDRAIEALSLLGGGFARAESAVVVQDGTGRRFIVYEDGTVDHVLRRDSRKLERVMREAHDTPAALR